MWSVRTLYDLCVFVSVHLVHGWLCKNSCNNSEPVWEQTHVGPRNHILYGGSDPTGRDTLRGDMSLAPLHSGLIQSWCHPSSATFHTRAASYSTHTHTQPFYCSSGICPGPPGWAGTRKVKPRRLKPIWIYWSKGKWVAVASAGLYASLHPIPDNHANIPPLGFYRPDALPDAQPTVSKHWSIALKCINVNQRNVWNSKLFHVCDPVV